MATNFATLNLLFCLMVCVYTGLVEAQGNCILKGTFYCTGGDLLGIDFGKDDDDNFFAYYAVHNSSDYSCTVLQEGTYSVDQQSIHIDFDDINEDCQISGNTGSTSCYCVSTMEFSATNNCTTIIGPKGDICEPEKPCEEYFQCPGGVTPIENPNRKPVVNGCGPSSIPIKGPSFSYLECCGNHDICYETCGTLKVECDNDFYQCMACSCQTEYSGFLSEGACMTAACSYYQAVEEFGCSSFASAQAKGCICPVDNTTEKAEAAHIAPLGTVMKSGNMKKFGVLPISRRVNEFLCEGPFEPNCGIVPANSLFGMFHDLSPQTLTVVFSLLFGLLVIIIFLSALCGVYIRKKVKRRNLQIIDDYEEVFAK